MGIRATPAEIADFERKAMERGGTVHQPQSHIVPGPTFYVHDQMTEKEFMAAVVEFAEYRGWKVYHTYLSIRSKQGYPDLTMVRHNDVCGGRVIFAELKTETGKMTKAQTEWRRALDEAGALFYLWRPSDWVEIERILS